MKISIVWFKTDLRLHDNEVLVNAIKQSDKIIPVYCLDSTQFSNTQFGFKKTGPFRLKFLLESLDDLKKSLKHAGSDLLILKGKPEKEIPKLVKQYNAEKVFAKKEVSFEELEIQQELEKELWKVKAVLEVFSTSTLYHPSDLPFSIKGIPDIFTDFRKKIEKEIEVRKVFEKPKEIPTPDNIPSSRIPSLESFGYKEQSKDPRTAYPFIGGETEGLRRIDYYLSQTRLVSSYKKTRNELIGKDYSSKFSAWLALGCLSPRYIFFELKKYEKQVGANDSTYWLYFELLWRDFFRFMMKKHKQKMFLFNGITNAAKEPEPINLALLEKWALGNTGNDFIDANMKELNATGYMSNRGRQNTASFLCNDLKLDWRYGAAYFEQQLVDYDECSNWGNWLYIAGVGNDPRKDRYFNQDEQVKKYDKDRAYQNLWLTK